MAAARREITLERLKRQRAESDLASLEATLAEQRGKIKELQAELKALRRDMPSSEDRREAAEERARLQRELEEAKEQVKSARKDAARRLKELQALQVRVDESRPLRASRGGAEATGSGTDGEDRPCMGTSPAPLMECLPLGGSLFFSLLGAVLIQAEKELREAAEAKSRALKAELERKDQLLAAFRKKVEEAREAEAHEAELQDKLASAQARVRELQAELQRKTSVLGQLKDKAEEMARSAEERAAREEADKAAAQLRKASSVVAAARQRGRTAAHDKILASHLGGSCAGKG